MCIRDRQDGERGAGAGAEREGEAAGHVARIVRDAARAAPYRGTTFPIAPRSTFTAL